jgi:AcrR family transcriptional regulator
VSATDVRPNQREHILDVSLRLMSERGATGMSMRQLANACDLQVAVVAERQYGSRLEDPLPVDPDAPPAERLTDVFVQVFEGALSEQSIWRLLIGEAMRGESTVLPVGQELLALLQPAAADWVVRAVPELANPDDLAQLVTGFIRTVFEPDVDPRTIALQVAAPLAALVED